MKLTAVMSAVIAAIVVSGGSASANDRYASRPPVLVSPDLSAPWVMQLQNRHTRRTVPAFRRKPGAVLVQPSNLSRQDALQRTDVSYRALAGTAAAAQQPAARQMDPKFLPQQVQYQSNHAPGTIVIDSAQKFLYLVQGNGEARRYGVGVGKEGMGWTGTEKITRKAQWPDWRPPAEMIARERVKGRNLPAFMAGGPANPLGARALYLGSTLYRIHGTNAPWTIGTNVSSGCIRLRNEDVVDLYEHVKVGAKVVVM
ncbi:MAG: L,D-transpeptidase [Rhizobiaceae bacterium]|nr:L,D-transpeptidase [Rhizobiaceae bacterium]